MHLKRALHLAAWLYVCCGVQGDHCAEVTITISDFTIGRARGANVPASVSAAQKVCWFKVSKQPVAKFDFDMCSNKKCECGRAEGWGLGVGLGWVKKAMHTCRGPGQLLWGEESQGKRSQLEGHIDCRGLWAANGCLSRPAASCLLAGLAQ
jgi:hypothetical protein